MEQDLSQKQVDEGAVFIIHLLMEEQCGMPDRDLMTKVMKEHLGDIDCFCHDDRVAGFALNKYRVQFKDGAVPPQLMVMNCISTDGFELDEMKRRQMWDCPESAEILSRCKYHVIATDMMARGLSSHDRAEMLTDYIEALAELYPQCRAMLFDLSSKMFTREQIINCKVPREQRFIYYAVNARFFTIEGTQDMIVDSLGMNVLDMPDVQYHFHGLGPNEVVNHAYNVLIYMLQKDCPFKNGDTIDDLKNGVPEEIKWTCQFEQSLIQPARTVLDINTGEFAAGRR